MEKYYKVWHRNSSSVSKEFDSEPVCNEKYLTTKIKSYRDKINKNFNDDWMPTEGFHCICLSVILIESVFKTIIPSYYYYK